MSKPGSFRTRRVAQNDGVLLKIKLVGQNVMECESKASFGAVLGSPKSPKLWSGAQKQAFWNSHTEPAKPAKVVSGAAARARSSTRARGQDGGS